MSSAFANLSLRLQLTVLVAVGLLPAIGVGAYVVHHSRQHQIDETRQAAEDAARRLSAVYARDLAAAANELLAAGDAVARGADDAERRQLLKIARRHASRFDLIGIVGDDQAAAVVDGDQSLLDGPWRGHPVIDAARRRRRLYMAAAPVDPQRPRSSIVMAAPATASDASEIVFAEMNVDVLRTTARDEQLLGAGPVVVVFDASGAIVMQHPDVALSTGRLAPDEPVFRLAEAPGRTSVESRWRDGVLRLYGGSRIDAPAVLTALYVAVGVPTNADTAIVSQALLADLTVFALAVAVALVAGVVAGDRLLAHPLREMIGANLHLRDGDVGSDAAPAALLESPRLITVLTRAAANFQKRDLEQRRDRDDLARQTRWFRALLECSSDGVVMLDRDGRFIYASPSTARFVGCPTSELIARPAVTFVHPNDRPFVTAQLADAVAKPGGFAQLRFRVQAVDGSCRWIEAETHNLLDDPEVRAIVGTYRDFTATETAMDKLSSAVEQSAESVLITDRNGAIEYVNPAFEAMTGYTREECIGRTPKILSSGQTPTHVYKQLWTTISAGKVFRAVVVNRRKSGELYDEDQTIAPIRDVSGEIVHFVSCGRDITPHKRTEEALRRLNAQLEHEAERIAGILHDEAGQFLAAAHIALADVSRELPPAQRARVQQVRHDLDCAEEQLRRVSHELHPRMLDDLGLTDAVRFLATSFGRRTSISVDVDVSLASLCPRPIETVFYRLVQEGLSNIGKHAQAQHVSIALAREADAVVCTIRDDGIGIDATADADGRDRGFSLGLAVMRDRVQAVGGSLTITSAPGSGTELRASVPVED